MNKKKIISGFLSASVAIGLLASCGETQPLDPNIGFWNYDTKELLSRSESHIEKYSNNSSEHKYNYTTDRYQEGDWGIKVDDKESKYIELQYFKPPTNDKKVFFACSGDYCESQAETFTVAVSIITAECVNYNRTTPVIDSKIEPLVSDTLQKAVETKEPASSVKDNVKITAKYDDQADYMYYIVESSEGTYGETVTPESFREDIKEETEAAYQKYVEFIIQELNEEGNLRPGLLDEATSSKDEEGLKVLYSCKKPYSDIEKSVKADKSSHMEFTILYKWLKDLAGDVFGQIDAATPVIIKWVSNDGKEIAAIKTASNSPEIAEDFYAFKDMPVSETPKEEKPEPAPAKEEPTPVPVEEEHAPAPKEEPAPAEKEEPVEINTARHSEEDSKFVAGQVVKAESPTPSTVEVCPWRDMTVQDLGNGHYQVVGWVDMENMYGAMVRYDFLVYYTATETGYKEYGAEFFPRGG